MLGAESRFDFINHHGHAWVQRSL